MQFKNNLLVQMIFSVTEMVLIMAVVLACIDDRFIFVLVLVGIDICTFLYILQDVSYQ
jgi:hypothetical protein